MALSKLAQQLLDDTTEKDINVKSFIIDMADGKCKIGLHDWEVTPAVYASPFDEQIGMTDNPATRKCNNCTKKQTEDVHCLGLNPPKYTKTWY